jgi:putative phosphoesterase
MKVAILSDIHANYRALETVINHVENWNPDVVIVAGDTINRGPRSSCCLKVIEEKRNNHGWHVIKGNHEDYVLERGQPSNPERMAAYNLDQPVQFAYNQISRKLPVIQNMPDEISLDLSPHGDIRVRHGSMKNNRDGIYPENSDSNLMRKISPAPKIFLTGHTHRPFLRNLNGCLILNAGSVGLPFDGDRRASYGQLIYQDDCWDGKIIRLDYNTKAAESDFYTYGFVDEGGPLVDLIRFELQSGYGQLYQWAIQYNQLILNQDMTVCEAVEAFLKKPITKPYW